MLPFTGNLNGKSQSLFTSFLGQQADAQDDGFEEEELFNMETLGMSPY